ncbi:MAG: serine hydrolase domain-containing protein [Promethearchaeota archaeon]
MLTMMINNLSNRIIAIILISLAITAIGVSNFLLHDTRVQPNRLTAEYWKYSLPENQGLDSTILNSMMDYIHEKNFPIDSVLVIKNGFLVLEEYPNSLYTKDTLHFIYSCTKSVTSALIGIAIEEGFINNIDQKVVNFFSERDIGNLDSRKKNMTIEHLLTMSAGFDWDEWTYWYWDSRNDLYQAIESNDMVQFILDRPMVYEPGAKWVYNSGASHLLSAIIHVTTGISTLDFAKKYLFEPLDINNINWGHDSQGVYYGGFDLYMRPRDMAKIGYLFLNNGTWNDQQIISTDWVTQSTKIAFYPWGSTGYGYQWWLNPSAGYYFASGLFAQRIIIIPECNLVVVFTAEIRSGSDPELNLLKNYILPAIKDNIITSQHNTSDYLSTLTLNTNSRYFKSTETEQGYSKGFGLPYVTIGLICLSTLIQTRKRK